MSHTVEALMNRRIDEEHEQFLLRCNGDLPDWLRLAYWQFKSIHDRTTNGAITDEELKQVVFVARMVTQQPPHDNPAKPYDVKQDIGGPVIYGTNVRAWWRKTEYKAMFIEEKRSQGGCVLLFSIPKTNHKGKPYMGTEEHFVPYHHILGLWVEPAPEPELAAT